MINPTDKQPAGDPPPGGVQSGVQDGRRTSFVLHLDTLSVIEKMTREQRGDFLTGLYRYRMGEPLGLDPMMEMVLHPFMAAMDRDDEKFATRADRSRANGSRGGRPRKTFQAPENPENPVGFSVTQKTCEGEGEGDEKGKETISKDLVAGAPKKVVQELDWSPLNLTPELAEAVKAIRKKHGSKGKVSQRVITTLAQELAMARAGGLSDEQIINEWDTRGWIGLKAEWLLKDRQQGQGARPSRYEQQMAAQAAMNARFLGDAQPDPHYQGGFTYEHE